MIKIILDFKIFHRNYYFIMIFYLNYKNSLGFNFFSIQSKKKYFINYYFNNA